MSKRWTVGSLIPGKETRFTEKNPPVRPTNAPTEGTRKPETMPSPLVQIKQGSVTCTVPVQADVLLLDAALEENCNIAFKCRKGTCGACTVDILSGSQFLSKPNAAEVKKLGQSSKRLACQALMK